MKKRIRILMAKPGLDGHDRGIKILARAYRDAGMEVIYLGLRQTPQMIVNAAIQEDVDVIALSILSGAHMTIFSKVLSLLHKEGADNILITGGGIIENTHRVLEKGQDVKIDWDAWEWPEIFKMMQEDGNIATEDMIQPINLGIGMILIIDKNHLSDVDAHLKSINEEYVVMGKVVQK